MFPEIIIVPAVVGIPSAVIALQLWLGHKERMAKLTGSPVPSLDSDPRMARVEQAIEAIAVEMERLGEGQRFLTRVLSERGALDRELPAPRPVGARGKER
jgi:hypothetical protein